MTTFAFPAHCEVPITFDLKEDDHCYTVTADIPLAIEVDLAAAKAEYRDGVLSLLLPKKP